MMPSGVKVLLALEPVSMSRSFDGLARIVQERFGRDPKIERTMFVFVNRRNDTAKVLWRDATGWCLLAKRLDERVLGLPSIAPGAQSVVLEAKALAFLLDGVGRRRQETGRDVVRKAREAAAQMSHAGHPR